MELFDRSLANNLKLNNWAENEVGATFKHGLKVKQSALGGYGIFFDSRCIPKESQNYEILRIPARSVLSLETCREIMRSCKQNKTSTLLFIQQCLRQYCSEAPVVSESYILVAYCVAFLVLKRLSRLDDLQSSSIGFVQQYLDVLIETKVYNLNNDDINLLIEYVNEFPGNTLIQEVVYRLKDGGSAKFAKYVNEELLKGKHYGIISDNDVIQIITAVRSRELEIPHDCFNANDEEGSNFTVGIKLVPILDFANHDNGQVNAYFDLDRSNNDVLLKLDTKCFKQQGGQVHEVFISYNPVEEISRFFVTYGFIPRSVNSRWSFVDVPFWGHFKASAANGTDLLNPNVLFAIKFGVDRRIDDVRICLTNKKEVVSAIRKMMKGDSNTILEKDALTSFVKIVRDGLAERAEKLNRYKTWTSGQKIGKGRSKNICELVEFGVEMAKKFTAMCEKETQKETLGNYLALVMEARNDHEVSIWDNLRLIPDFNEKEEHTEG